jgi:hypothetical protein
MTYMLVCCLVQRALRLHHMQHVVFEFEPWKSPNELCIDSP